jgi:hypothetical protein
MGHRGGWGPQEAILGGSPNAGCTDDELYQILANRRRRYVIHHLQQHGGQTDISSLAERIAAWENGSEISELTAPERKNTYTALHQRHLPKLDEAGIVAFNDSRGVVEPTERLDDVTVYTEVVGKRDLPWSLYYLGLAAVSLGLMAAISMGVPPFAGLSALAGGIFCPIALTLSAAVHHYIMHRSRLGTSERPPEVTGTDG